MFEGAVDGVSGGGGGGRGDVEVVHFVAQELFGFQDDSVAVALVRKIAILHIAGYDRTCC
jgi:hypothetical protein